MPQTALRRETSSNEAKLYMAFELSNREWKLAFRYRAEESKSCNDAGKRLEAAE